MIWEDYWKTLQEKAGIIRGQVVMSPAQFEKMQKQAFDVGRKQGCKEGCEQTKKINDFVSSFAGKQNSTDFGDILGSMLGGKPR